MKRTLAAALAATYLSAQCLSGTALADNQMGYRLLPVSEAAGLPRNGGVLGMDVGPAQKITDSGMTFEILRINSVGRSSPAAQAGFKSGDHVIAVDGRVFPSVPAFAAYIGSMPPGRQISVDYIPSGGGVQQAERVSVTLAATGKAGSAASAGPGTPAGLSTRTKILLGLGAAAVFGCYKVGCFSHGRGQPATGTQ